MDGARRHLVLVNPSAGGGRAAKLVPELERALRDLRPGVPAGAHDGASSTAARRLDGPPTHGEIPVVMSGDGLVGQVGGVLAGGEVPIGVIPGGRGNDFARVLGIPTEISGRRRAARRRLHPGDRRRRGQRPPLPLHRQLRVRLRRQPDRQRGAPREGKPRLRCTRRCGRSPPGSPLASSSTLDGERHEFTGYSVAAANSKAYGGGMFLAPDAELDDGKLDVVWVSEVGQAPLPG